MQASLDRASLPPETQPISHAPEPSDPEPGIRNLLAAGNARLAFETFQALPSTQRNEPQLMLLAVEIQIYLGDWDAALDRMRALFTEHPRCPALHGLRTALWDMIATGRAREVHQKLLARARHSERNGQWIEAIDLWMQLRASGYDPREPSIAIGRSLSRLGDREAAEMTLGHLSRSHPGDLEILAEYAQLPGRYDDWAAGAARWISLFDEHPDAVFFVGPAAEAYRRSGNIDAATRLIEHALATRPADLAVLVPAAVAAEQNENWALAVRCWRGTLAVDPANATVKELLGRAVWNETLNQPPEASPEMSVLPQDVMPDGAELDFNAILATFENLTDNCELGLVQRHYGAEPVGLYRFSAISPVSMIELLDLKFAPLGDPAHTIVKEHDREYMLVDDRDYFQMHTMVPKDQSSPEKILKQQGARISIMRRKLLSDLASGKKIFVCKTSESPVSDETLNRMSEALRRHGNNFLLGVRVADADHPAGTLSEATAHTAIGYVAHMFGHGLDPIDYDNWKLILEKTFRYWSSLGASLGASLGTSLGSSLGVSALVPQGSDR